MSAVTACRSCGAAMAGDQRYCLNCGARLGEARVAAGEYRDRVAPTGAGAPPASPASDERPPSGEAERKPSQRDYAPLAAAGGIAVLGIMLLIGVLIGRGTGSTTSGGGTPQVVTVEAAGTASGSGDAGEGEKQATASGSGKSSKKSKKGGSADTGGAPVASDAQLQDLQEQSPEEYQESSAKLPDEIATPGEAPPTDNKAPGGGSGAATIE